MTPEEQAAKRAAIVADLRNTTLKIGEIAVKHDVGYSTVMHLHQQYVNNRRRGRPYGRGKKRGL